LLEDREKKRRMAATNMPEYTAEEWAAWKQRNKYSDAEWEEWRKEQSSKYTDAEWEEWKEQQRTEDDGTSTEKLDEFFEQAFGQQGQVVSDFLDYLKANRPSRREVVAQFCQSADGFDTLSEDLDEFIKRLKEQAELKMRYMHVAVDPENDKVRWFNFGEKYSYMTLELVASEDYPKKFEWDGFRSVSFIRDLQLSHDEFFSGFRGESPWTLPKQLLTIKQDPVKGDRVRISSEFHIVTGYKIVNLVKMSLDVLLSLCSSNRAVMKDLPPRLMADANWHGMAHRVIMADVAEMFVEQFDDMCVRVSPDCGDKLKFRLRSRRC